MIALYLKNNVAYQVVKYTLKVHERGSDTEFGKEELIVYCPLRRSKFPLESDYVIYNSWKDLPATVKMCDDSEDEEMEEDF